MKILILMLIFIMVLNISVMAFEIELPDIPKDKQMHFGAGLGIYILSKEADLDYPLLYVISIGAGKEVYDFHMPNHNCEFMDFVYTLLGGICGYIVTEVGDNL